MAGAAENAETLAMVREGARGFIDAHHSIKRLRRLHGNSVQYENEVWRALAEAGWLGLRVPEALGGSEQSIAEAVVLCEVFAEALLPEPLLACALLPSIILSGSKNDVVVLPLLSGLIEGRIMLALAWEEAVSELTPGPLRTELKVFDETLHLNGNKQFVAGALGADHYLVSCLYDGELALVAVPASATGIAITPVPQLDGSVSAHLGFSKVTIRREQILALGNEAERLLTTALDEATLAVSAMSLAVARRALKMSLDYMGTRVQFGHAIGSFQALQHRAVDMQIRCTLADATLRHAIMQTRARAASAAADISAAKVLCARAATTVTRNAVQFHGGIGYTDEIDIGLYLKSALRLAAWLGSVPSHRRRFMAAIGEGTKES